MNKTDKPKTELTAEYIFRKHNGEHIKHPKKILLAMEEYATLKLKEQQQRGVDFVLWLEKEKWTCSGSYYWKDILDDGKPTIKMETVEDLYNIFLSQLPSAPTTNQ